MWFKNIQVYCYSQDVTLTPESLESKLAERCFQACPKSQPAVLGWSSPFGADSSVLVHASGGYLLFTLCKEQRLLPASVVREAVMTKVAEIEATQQRKVSRKERLNLRDELTLTLLPQAFTRKTFTYAYFDTHAKWLIIDAASSRKCEELIDFLRTTLGSLPLQPLQTKQAPALIMREWLLEESHDPVFVIDNLCELRDEDASAIKCQNMDLFSDEVQAHLAKGKQVMQLAVTWQNKISYVVKDPFTLKRVRFLDIVQEKREKAETYAEQLDADFTIMSQEFSLLLHDKIAQFGGIDHTC